MSNAQNLDILCAQTGNELAGIRNMEERVINAALSVLEVQGPYAMFLYLQARHNKIFDEVEDRFKTLLQQVFQGKLNAQSDVFAMISTLAANLDDLLFARDLLRITLAYARYHRKAKGSVEG